MTWVCRQHGKGCQSYVSFSVKKLNDAKVGGTRFDLYEYWKTIDRSEPFEDFLKYVNMTMEWRD